MRFQVLGPLEVHGTTSARPVRGGRPRVLLHLLLVQRRLALPVDVIADRLWGEELPADAANALHQLVSYLRRALGEEGRRLLTTSPSGYRLDVADDAVDAWRFERHVQTAGELIPAGTASAARQALAEVDRATALWRGEPFSESAAYAWMLPEIARLKEAYLAVQEARLDALLLLGRHREVVMEAESLAAAYPLRERFHARRSLALYRSGRQSEALEVHRAVRSVLAQELGLDPGPELRKLESDILSQDEGLLWTPPHDLQARREVRPTVPTEVPDGPRPTLPAPHQLPVPATPLVGREEAVASLLGMVTPGRVLTILGPGGVGKSRLALAVAAADSARPTWLVDLSDVQDPSLVAGTIANRLGLSAPFPHDPTERIVDAVREADGLLILDTCEHVVGELAPLLASVLAASPRLRVVATSRRPLDLGAELVFHVEPLSIPDPRHDDVAVLRESPAVRLFIDRARAVRCDLVTEDSVLGDAGVIVSMLGGLPLAIELAAAHCDVLGVAQVRSRLETSIDALPARTVETAPRQRSLRAVMDSSLVLMSESERAFFPKLGVFVGGFGLEDAAAVTEVTVEEALTLVSSLVRQSVLLHDGAGRYRLLDPIRFFALELLDDLGQLERLRDRHAEHVAAEAQHAARQIRGSNQTEVFDRLSRLLPDARAALTWSIDRGQAERAGRIAVSFAWWWSLHGLADEGLAWLSSVAGCDVADRGLRAEILRTVGLLANPVGQLELARSTCAEAAALSRELGDRRGLATALMSLGIAQWAMGDLDGAAASQDEAVEATRAWSSGWLHQSSLLLRARTAVSRDEADAAERVSRVVALTRESGERQLMAMALVMQAQCLVGGDELESAAVLAEEALRIFRELGYREGEMSALNALGRVLVSQGAAARAESLLLESLDVAERAKHPGAMCESLESLAFAASSTGRHERAYLLCQVSALQRARIHNPVTIGRKRLRTLVATTRQALGGAARTVDARASLIDFDEFVRELVSTRGYDGAAADSGTSPDVDSAVSLSGPATDQPDLLPT